MELKDIMNLVNAGFTKDEILALSESAQRPAAAQTEPEQVHAEEPAPAAVNNDGLLEAQAKQIEALNASIGELSEKIRQMNLLSAVMPESAVKPASAQDIIGKIINPYTKKEV